MITTVCSDYSSSSAHSAGRDDLNEIAAEDGITYENEESGEEGGEDEDAFQPIDVAANFIRVLHQEEEYQFVICIEMGINDRDIHLEIINESTEIELSYRVPRPPDGLFQAAGLHATMAEAQETAEVFYFTPSKRLAGTHAKLYYPNEETAEWAIFKYDLEKPRKDTPETMNLCTRKLRSSNK